MAHIKTRTYFLLIFLLVISVSLFYACKKMDFASISKTTPVEKFFAIPANTPAPVIKVAEALKRQNDIGGFIPAFARKEGYPIWNKSVIQERHITPNLSNRDGEGASEQATLVFTPIVQQDSNKVNGFLFSRIINDSVELHLYRANDYDQYPYGPEDSSVVTAERITLALTELNYKVFGYKKHIIQDTFLFKKHFKLPAENFTRTIELKAIPGGGAEGNLYCQPATSLTNCEW
ncbi:MAG: hypothetical protein QM763_24845 [Agriterribacter sp.]